MRFYEQNSQKVIYNQLIQTVADCISWSTVEGISLASLHLRLLQTEQQAQAAGLSNDEIQLALQIGEGRGRFELT